MQTPQPLPGPDPTPLPIERYHAPWVGAFIGGIALVLVGLVILLLPGVTLALAMQFIGLFWLVDGVVGLACIFRDRSYLGWKLLAGILSVVGGLYVIQHPLWDATFVPIVSNLIIGIIGILIGLSQLILATSGGGLRTGIPGAVSLVFGIILALLPTLGAAFVPYLLGGLALVGGGATMVAAIRRRST